jgi:ankyrin repeat protein
MCRRIEGSQQRIRWPLFPLPHTKCVHLKEKDIHCLVRCSHVNKFLFVVDAMLVDELLRASENGNVTDVRRILSQQPVNHKVCQSLHFSHYNVRTIWPNLPVDWVALQNAAGDTPLIIASLNGHLNTTRLLIENGANVNDRVNDAWEGGIYWFSVFFFLSLFMNLKCVCSLERSGVHSIDVCSKGRSSGDCKGLNCERSQHWRWSMIKYVLGVLLLL